MKYIKNFTHFPLFENKQDILSRLPASVNIDEFVTSIGLQSEEAEKFTQLWQENRSGFNIHLFQFKTVHPIMGVFFYDNIVCINTSSRAPSLMKAFIALHESRHADQWSKGIFEDKDFKTVAEGNREEFLEGYQELESDANTYALEVLKGGGFKDFVLKSGPGLRMNEYAGPQVYKMMDKDIRESGSTSMAELIASQIL